MGANREQQVRASERQRQALQLRMAGVSYEDIAARVGYRGRSGAHGAVMRAIAGHVRREILDLVDQGGGHGQR